VPTPLIVLLLLAASLAIAAWRSRRLIQAIAAAPAPVVPRWDQPWERLRFTAAEVGLHRRLRQRRLSGTLHAFLFSGFLVLFSAIMMDFGAGLFPGFSLRAIGGETWIALLQDVFGVLILVAIGLAAWQRFVLRPPRFAGSSTADATIIYVLVLLVVIGMFVEFACGIRGSGSLTAWHPVASALAALLGMAGVTPAAAATARDVAYWLHIGAVLAFLAYIPGSKHRHIFTAIPNIFLHNISPHGALPASPEARRQVGINRIEQFSWKDILDFASCTECGRCQAVCPAYAAGQPLSPKQLIMDLRDSVMENDGPMPLLGGTIREETLWACTTCGACMGVCPIHIEHVPKIVEMRRQLVEDARVGANLTGTLSNLQRTGNSMGKPGRQRARWTKDLSFKVKDARKEPVDILWFVGDYASFDPRAQRVTIALAKLLHAAGIDFGILGDAEQNSGNDVRRVGEEGLFQLLARTNIDSLAECNFRRIMTTDPHSLNALRQEYPALGGHFEVLHHTQLLLELVESGRLQLRPGAGTTVTYHDPCYLGRYNGCFEAPRALIARAGYVLHDMPRCREGSFCCGAGGGRIWGDDTGIVERPSENRIKEALALGDARIFVVACPKDMVMYTAAVQALSVEDQLVVRDIVDLLEVAVEPALT
jgi:Fe-S oxidoreductase